MLGRLKETYLCLVARPLKKHNQPRLQSLAMKRVRAAVWQMVRCLSDGEGRTYFTRPLPGRPNYLGRLFARDALGFSLTKEFEFETPFVFARAELSKRPSDDRSLECCFVIRHTSMEGPFVRWPQPIWLKHFCSNLCCSHAKASRSCFHLWFTVRRRSMPRRGWQSLDVSAGWVQVLRGPRPPSMKWPPARVGSRAPSRRWRQPKEKSSPPQSTPPPLRQVSRAPEVVAADAVAEVKRLENAIQVLGETNPHAQPLVEALTVARAKTTKTFVERARQRVARAEAVIARAIEQKEIHVKEVSEGESRLQTLMSGGSSPCACPSSESCSDRSTS